MSSIIEKGTAKTMKAMTATSMVIIEKSHKVPTTTRLPAKVEYVAMFLSFVPARILKPMFDPTRVMSNRITVMDGLRIG
jgi:hypothetical protein